MNRVAKSKLTKLLFVVALIPPMLHGCDCGETPAPAEPARILEFSASEMTVESGEPVTLTWRVEKATDVTITASGVGTPLINKSMMAIGTVETAPITADTTFTLLATGTGGNAMQMVTVTLMATPAEVAIRQFAGAPLSIKAGESATLSYDVANAEKITIAVMGGMTIYESTTEFTGSTTVSPLINTAYVLTAEGEGGPKTQTVTISVDGTPVIMSFTANPQAVREGESSTLSWNVENAMTVIVRDSSGGEVFNGTNLAGSTIVTPAQTETYTLTAESIAGIQDTAMVMVTVNLAAEVQSFTVNPTSVDYGDPAVLSWDVVRATGIDIEAFGTIIHSSTQLTGSFSVTATTTTNYLLHARSPDGDATAMVTLNVNPIAPRVQSFEVSPSPALIGTSATLSWSSIGAVSIVIKDQLDNIVYSGADPSGNIMVQVENPMTTYTLVATNPNGETRMTAVLIGQNIPTLDVFTVSPPTFVGTATVTITFETTDATSTQLLVDGVPRMGYPTATLDGTYEFTISRTSILTFQAINGVGRDEATFSVIGLDAEIEPNDSAAGAQPLAGDGGGVAGNIGPTGGEGGDLDYYAVTVGENGNIRVETSDGLGGCNFDTVVTLLGNDGTTVLGNDDDDGPAACSLIDPVEDSFAANLSAGTYYLQVRGFGTGSVGDYVILVTVSPPRCGNRIFERGAAEQCDDGNLIGGDGCGPTCQVETRATIMGPGTDQTQLAGIVDETQADYFQIDMAADGFIRVETFVPIVGRCDTGSGEISSDTVVTLFDSNFGLLGSDNDDGIGTCSLIDPRYDSFAHVTAGTYYVKIEENGGNSTIENYVVLISTLPTGCRNGIIETGEDCDDGNSNDFDGCSAMCTFEGSVEVEPNGTFATGNVLTGAPPYVVRGSINPTGDLDFFLVDVPDGHHLDAYVTINSFDSCPADPTGRVAFFDTTGTIQGVANTTGGPRGACGRAWPYTITQTRALTAGRYGIRVNENLDDAIISEYFLHIDVIAPGCGNTILETGETCEDGNSTSGDGCSDVCRLEPVRTIALGPMTTSTLAGSIIPTYNRDAVQLDVSAPVYLRAETFVDISARSCPSISTVLRLLDSTQLIELGSDTTDGIGNCSAINPIEGFARLMPGTYFLVVEENGNNNEIGAYELEIRGLPVDVCGNSVLETGLGEQCDDGNLTAGDGCTSTCQIEPDAIIVGPPGGPMTYPGAITPIGDVDFYRIDLSAPGIIIAETGSPVIGSCPSANTLIRLYSSALVELASDNDNGPNLCSSLNGLNVAAARVDAGTYFLRVEELNHDAEIAGYQLRIELRAQNLCGNGLREGMEQCDDANTTSGDGCDASCQLEPDGVFNGPPLAPTTLSQAITPAGDTDYYQVVLSAPAILIAETGAPTAGVCTTADTYMRLYDSSFTELTSDDDGGPDFCSRISGVSTAEARLEAGTYWIRVEDFNGDDTIAAYQLTVELREQNVCGNGVPEGAEQCDDGNTTSADGCSAVCTNENILIPEVEGNNTPATAQALGVQSPGLVFDIQASITPIGDVDFFTFTTLVPTSVMIGTYGSIGGLFTTCSGDTQLWLYHSVPSDLTATMPSVEPAIVTNGYSDDDNFSNCSLIDGSNSAPARLSIPAGTYYVQVREFFSNAAIPNYFLRFDFQ